MIVAILKSETKTWVAKGKTEEEAKKNILKKWNDEQDILIDSYRKYGEIWTGYKFSSVVKLEDEYDISIYDLTTTNCEVR